MHIYFLLATFLMLSFVLLFKYFNVRFFLFFWFFACILYLFFKFINIRLFHWLNGHVFVNLFDTLQFINSKTTEILITNTTTENFYTENLNLKEKNVSNSIMNLNIVNVIDTSSIRTFDWVVPVFQEQMNHSVEFFDSVFNSSNSWTRRIFNIKHLFFDSYDNFLLHCSEFYPKIIYDTNRLWWRTFAKSFCDTNVFTKDYVFAFVEVVAYNFVYLGPAMFYNTALQLPLFFYLFFIFVFVVAVIATTTQQYLGIAGLLRLLFYTLLLQFVVILCAFVAITQYGVTFFLEYKIYSIYVPTAVASLNFTLDYLSASFMFLVTSIGIAAILYSRVYLIGDPNTPDFLIKLNWFIISMLSLVISKNFIFFYFSWEFIGITSMWLINFNSQRTDTFKSAIKAFTFNKVSDLCLFSALLIGYSIFQTATITTWDVSMAQINYINTTTAYSFYAFGTLIIIAASIKSAQLGFHLWLPDSMDAPVPASALIHSATLVSAGIYILFRFYDIIHFAGFSTSIALLGACTAAYGGVVAGMQTDLKRALAYSTISHCGFLFTLTVLGGSSIALLYLFLHGFYKALSFICAGDFIRLGAGYQDLNRMGGFFFLSPSLSAQFLISMGNLCGLPFFLGYFFKNNFQSAQLVNNNANFFVNTLLICGLISSLFYFFKVFYCVVFSFKKTNYKNLIDFYKKSLLSFKFPFKSPKALLIIFWFILFVSLCCVFWYFNYILSTLACNVTDTQVSVVDLNFLQRANIKVSEFTKVNYFFLFYTVFCNAILVLHLYNSCRRTGWPSFLNNMSTVTIFLFFSFFCFV